MKKSGLADSPFFLSPEPKTEATPPPLPESEAPKAKPVKVVKPKEKKPEQPSNRDTVVPRHQDTAVSRDDDTTVPRHQDTAIPNVHGVSIDLVRKTVKEFGKEAATHRFTEAEKKQVADLIYTYKNRGIKTSENEIARISINFVMEDFRVNGENSVLHKIIAALNE